MTLAQYLQSNENARAVSSFMGGEFYVELFIEGPWDTQERFDGSGSGATPEEALAVALKCAAESEKVPQ